jgi:hypothetical protein
VGLTKTWRKKKYFFIGRGLFLKGSSPIPSTPLPIMEYGLFKGDLCLWGQKKIFFFYIWYLFLKGAPLFRVRPFPLRYVLWSTAFSKGGCLWGQKKNIFIWRGLFLKGAFPIRSTSLPIMKYVLFQRVLACGVKKIYFFYMVPIP